MPQIVIPSDARPRSSLKKKKPEDAIVPASTPVRIHTATLDPERQSPLTGRRSPLSGRRSPLSGRRSPSPKPLLRTPTPLLPTIQALTHAGDNDTDDSRELQKRRLGLSTRDLSQLGLRPSTGLRASDLGLRNSVSDGSLPVMHDRTGSRMRYTPFSMSRACSSKSIARGRASPALSRASTARQKNASRQGASRQGATILEGLSSPVEIENERLNTDLMLYAQAEDDFNGDEAFPPSPCVFGRGQTSYLSPSGRSSRRSSRMLSLFRGTEQEFLAEVDATKSLIEDLRERQEVFDPKEQLLSGTARKSTRGDPSDGHRRSESRRGMDDEELQQERLELYKMCKKVEEPLPSLVPPGMSHRMLRDQMPELEEPDKRLVEYNMSEQAMQHWTSRERQEYMNERQNQKRYRAVEAQKCREYLNGIRTNEYAQKLRRKEIQVEQKTLEKKMEAQRLAGLRTAHATEQWLTMCAICFFLRSCKEELSMGKMSTQERLAMERDGGFSKRHRNSGFLHEAHTLNDILTEDKCTRNFKLLADMWSSKVAVKNNNNACHIIQKCLCAWRPAQVFVRFRRFLNKVRFVQAWWKTTRQELYNVRDQISKRWERLEHSHLVQVLRKQQGLPALGMTGTSSSGVTSFSITGTSSTMSSSYTRHRRGSTVGADERRAIHERIEAEVARQMIPQRKRLGFLSNELRARRRKLLPALKVYRDDLIRWREYEESRRNPGRAPKQLVDRIFRMPPTRPSYLPVGHLASCMGVGGPCQHCSKWCPGERGDKEILSWRALLKSQPKHLSPTSSLSSMSSSRLSSPLRDSQQSGSFGVVSEEDLKKHSIDWRKMPGITNRRDSYDPRTL